MTDLIRLMFDDGAHRPAVADLPGTFILNGRKWRTIIYDKIGEQHRIYGRSWSFWRGRSDCVREDFTPMFVDNFLDNAQAWVNRNWCHPTHLEPGNEPVVSGRLSAPTHDIVFAEFVEVL